jgi:hypothetical protein
MDMYALLARHHAESVAAHIRQEATGTSHGRRVIDSARPTRTRRRWKPDPAV